MLIILCIASWFVRSTAIFCENGLTRRLYPLYISSLNRLWGCQLCSYVHAYPILWCLGVWLWKVSVHYAFEWHLMVFISPKTMHQLLLWGVVCTNIWCSCQFTHYASHYMCLVDGYYTYTCIRGFRVKSDFLFFLGCYSVIWIVQFLGNCCGSTTSCKVGDFEHTNRWVSARFSSIINFVILNIW